MLRPKDSLVKKSEKKVFCSILRTIKASRHHNTKQNIKEVTIAMVALQSRERLVP